MVAHRRLLTSAVMATIGGQILVLYVDLPDSISEGKVWLFEDVSHLIHQKDEVSLRNKAQLGLNEMSDWCKKNKLLNKKKTKALTFYNCKKPESNPLLGLDGSSIAVVECAKYLVITISSDLRWQKPLQDFQQ
ncbi:hypothetical protein J6590_065972 [Homalodisca vitripennis]|nr:hypothetical protein J6590_065972 [Homalodisca vitripennis]